MPRKITPRLCHCGCGEMTRGGEFKPGHDSQMMGAVVQAAGGVREVHALVEKALKRKIDSHLERLK